MARTPRLVDADGKPLEPTEIYFPLMSYADPAGAVPRRDTRLRGDDPVVQRTPSLWARADSLASAEIDGRQRIAEFAL